MHKYALDEYAYCAYRYRMKLETYLSTRKFTDEAFGRRIGCSQSQVSRIKRGISKPSLGLTERIAVATGGLVKANDFMSLPVLQPVNSRKQARASA